MQTCFYFITREGSTLNLAYFPKAHRKNPSQAQAYLWPNTFNSYCCADVFKSFLYRISFIIIAAAGNFYRKMIQTFLCLWQRTVLYIVGIVLLFIPDKEQAFEILVFRYICCEWMASYYQGRYKQIWKMAENCTGMCIGLLSFVSAQEKVLRLSAQRRGCQRKNIPAAERPGRIPIS